MSSNNVQVKAVDEAVMHSMRAAVATAQEFPRKDIAIIKKECVDIIKSSFDIAEDMLYRYPVKEKQENGTYKSKDIIGPTIRMAELILQKYKNIYVSDNQQYEVDGKVVAICFAWDMESNNIINTKHEIRITDRNGKYYTRDFADLLQRSAMAKARRNAILTIIPSEVIDACRKAAEETIKAAADPNDDTPEKKAARKRKVVGVRDAIGLTDAELCQILGVEHPDDIIGEAYGRLVQMWKAFEDGASKETLLNPEQKTTSQKKAASIDLSKHMQE